MEETIKETNTVGIILDWLWGVFVLGGCSYLVFFKSASGWWFLLACLLLSATFLTKKTEIEEN